MACLRKSYESMEEKQEPCVSQAATPKQGLECILDEDLFVTPLASVETPKTTQTAPVSWDEKTPVTNVELLVWCPESTAWRMRGRPYHTWNARSLKRLLLLQLHQVWTNSNVAFRCLDGCENGPVKFPPKTGNTPLPRWPMGTGGLSYYRYAVSFSRECIYSELLQFHECLQGILKKAERLAFGLFFEARPTIPSGQHALKRSQ